MKMSQMFKTTLAAAMIMALAVTAGCGGGGAPQYCGYYERILGRF